jgi:integrase
LADFGHPDLGVPLDRTKLTRTFKAACETAGVCVIRFHDLRHAFATTLAADSSPVAHPSRSAWRRALLAQNRTGAVQGVARASGVIVHDALCSPPVA